jgi:hypothetical protein
MDYVLAYSEADARQSPATVHYFCGEIVHRRMASHHKSEGVGQSLQQARPFAAAVGAVCIHRLVYRCFEPSSSLMLSLKLN